MIFCFYKIAVSFQVIFVLFLLTFQRTNRDSIGGDYLIWQLKIFLWSFKTHILNYPPLIKWGGIEKLKYCLSNGTLKQLTIVFALLIYMLFNYYPSPPPPLEAFHDTMNTIFSGGINYQDIKAKNINKLKTK